MGRKLKCKNYSIGDEADEMLGAMAEDSRMNKSEYLRWLIEWKYKRTWMRNKKPAGKGSTGG